MSSRLFSALVAAVLTASAACSPSHTSSSHEITVAAAASLSLVFQKIGSAFEAADRGDIVRFSFSSSNGLATQIQQGLPVDVFASAAPKWLDDVAKDPGVLARAVFARNRLVLIVPHDDPAHLARFADVVRAGVRLVLAAPGVPAGDYARQALAKAGLRAALRNLVSNEQDVEGVVAKVASGDADAGIVYTTDVTPATAPSIRTIPVPDAANVTAVYEIGVVRGTKASEVARAFMAYVLGPGQDALRLAGFSAPA